MSEELQERRAIYAGEPADNQKCFGWNRTDRQTEAKA